MSKVFKSWEESGIDYNPRRTGEQKTLCPECSHTRKNKSEKCLSVNISKGVANCHNCGYGVLVAPDDKPYTPVKNYTKPEVYTGSLSERARAFFDGRGIEERTLEYFKISEEKRGISFPYYQTIQGVKELVNVKFRAPGKKFSLVGGAKLIFFNLDSIKDNTEAIITEGEMDCMSLYQCDFFNAVSVPNGASKGSQKLEYLDNCIDYFEGKTKIILAVDNDEAGLSLQNELIRRLGHERCYTITYPEGCKDANEVLMRHGKQAVKEMIRGAQAVPLQGVFTSNDIIESVMDIYRHGFPKGDRVGYSLFDNLLSFLPGQLTTITGIPGSGKSNFIDQLLVRMGARLDRRFGIFSPEQQPTEFHVANLIQKYVGEGMFGRGQMNETKLKRALEFVNDHFYFLKQSEVDTTIDGILAKAVELVARHGINYFLIDPYNYIEHKVPHGYSETQYICELLNKIKNFCRAYQVHVFLIAHPTKIQKDKKTGKYEVPTMYSIAGSAHFYNITDNGITVYRDFETNLVSAYVQKVRFSFAGRIGYCDFTYDVPTGRYAQEGDKYESELREGGQVALPVPEPPREKGELTDFKYMALGEPQF